MAPPDPSTHASRSFGFERLIFFSDAVFAIAITLLVLNLKPTFGAHDAFLLTPLIPKLIGFGLSFFVVGRYWLSHHHLFEAVHTYDARLLRANLWFLASVAFLPFPTSVVTEAQPGTGPVAFYLLSLAAVGLLLIGLALVARRPALLKPGETRGGTANMIANMAAGPVVFIVAAAAALYVPRLALWLLFLLFPVGWILDRVGRSLQRRMDAAASG